MTLRGFQDSSDARIRREVDRLNSELTRHYRIAREEIQSQLDRLYARTLSGIPADNYYATMIKFNRLTTLQKQVTAAYNRAHNASRLTIGNGSRLAMANTYYQNQYALVGPSAVQGISIGFHQLPEELVNLAVTGTPESFRAIDERIAQRFGEGRIYQPKYGTLSDMLVNRRLEDLKRVQDTIVQAFIQGKGPREAARSLDRALAIGRNNAERIMRTEMHRTQMLGQFAATENARAEGVDVRRQIVSVLDDRTRPQSARVDGRMEDENGFFDYPGTPSKVRVPGNSGNPAWDINDREGTIDIVDGVEPTARRMRVPGDRPPPAERDRLRAAGLPIPGETYIVSWQNFDSWASANGLTRNRYGQWVA